MSSGAARRLTDRQRAVIERIDRRVPIKVIAQELGVSETRINQHIRVLKDVYEAGSLGELVEIYRATLPPEPVPEAQDKALGAAADTVFDNPFSEVAYTKTQINAATDFPDLSAQDDPGRLVLSDAMPLIEQAPWLRPGEPRVVPGVLDGDHAVLLRLGAIVGIASGILAAVVLTVTAAVALSDAMNGKAAVSVETSLSLAEHQRPRRMIMNERILADAHQLKKLVREAEAIADESIIAMARLKQAMLAARQNPEIEVHTGQRALMRLTEAEGQAMSMSTNLLRVHDELSKVARVHAGGEDGTPTVIPKEAMINAVARSEPVEA